MELTIKPATGNDQYVTVETGSEQTPYASIVDKEKSGSDLSQSSTNPYGIPVFGGDRKSVEMVKKSEESIRNIRTSQIIRKNNAIHWSDVTVEKELGRGAFGVVYLGKYRLQQCAVKELLNPSPETENEFFKEASVWAELRPHPNVVNFVGIINSEGRLAMVVEYVPNGTIEKYYGQYKLDTATILRFALDICRGMVHLNAEGVVHRDLACRNLLVRNGSN